MVAATPDIVGRWQAITASGGGGFITSITARLVNPDGSVFGEPLPVVGCQWGWDGASTKPLSGSVAVPATDWSRDPAVDWRPASLHAPLSPFGRRLAVALTVDSGEDRATVPLGVGLISQVAYARPAEVVTVTLTDLAAELDQALTVVDFPILAPMPLADVVTAVIVGSGGHRPTVTNIPAGMVQPRTWPAGTSCWQIIQDAVQSVDPGLRAWFDRGGVLRAGAGVDGLGPVPAGDPVYVLGTGPGGHVTELESVLSRDGVVNTVAVAVEDSDIVDPTYTDVDGDATGMAVVDLDDLQGLSGAGTLFARPVRVTQSTSGGVVGGGDAVWVPRPDDNRGHARSPRELVAWARQQEGRYWPSGRCLSWVSIGITGGDNNDYDGTGYGGLYAKYVWFNRPEYATDWPRDFNPPVGSLVVWNSPTGGVAGHVGISIGGGMFISATGGRVVRLKIAGFGTGGSASYLGAVVPY